MRVLRKLAALAAGFVALGVMVLPAVANASSTTKAAPLAGVCTVSGTWFEGNANGSMTVTANSDSCTGGGTIKWQAEEQCAITTGGTLYTYGGWKSGPDTSIAGDTRCTTGAGGEMLDGYIRINMNNPERTTLWVNGQLQHGSFSVHS
jgi:hypothetical protein